MALNLQLSTTVLIVSWSLSLLSRQNMLMGNYFIFIILMSFYKILVQPAKSSKGKCKVCASQIQKDSLRVQVRDDRRLNDYIKKHGGYKNFQGSQGMSRGGYIQTENGCISVEKYFVHLQCYVPIKSHPFTEDYFKRQKISNKNQEQFRQWLDKKAESQQPEKQRSHNKRKIIKKETKIKK